MVEPYNRSHKNILKNFMKSLSKGSSFCVGKGGVVINSLIMSFITGFILELAVKLWPFMGAFNARSLKHLAVKKAHGVPIAKLKLIKNRGQIMPPTSSMKFNYYFIFNKLISYFIFYLFLFQSLN